MGSNTKCNPRNVPLGFACRVQKNLEFIFEQRRKGKDVHEVTQVIVSLLGLIVFPWEREHPQVLKLASGKKLSQLEEEGWPLWHQVDECRYRGKSYQQGTLARLIRNLRNGIAHGYIHFSSDDRDAGEVVITFENYQDKKSCWKASISADQLKKFCEKFVNFVLNSDIQ